MHDFGRTYLGDDHRGQQEYKQRQHDRQHIKCDEPPPGKGHRYEIDIIDRCVQRDDQIASICWIIEKAREFKNTSTSASLTTLKPFTKPECGALPIRSGFLGQAYRLVADRLLKEDPRLGRHAVTDGEPSVVGDRDQAGLLAKA